MPDDAFVYVPQDRALAFCAQWEKLAQGHVSIDDIQRRRAVLEFGDILPGYGVVQDGQILNYDDFDTGRL